MCGVGEASELREGEAVFWQSSFADALFSQYEANASRNPRRRRLGGDARKPDMSRTFIAATGQIVTNGDARGAAPKVYAEDWSLDSAVNVMGSSD